jgi:hypothetical protein
MKALKGAAKLLKIHGIGLTGRRNSPREKFDAVVNYLNNSGLS